MKIFNPVLLFAVLFSASSVAVLTAQTMFYGDYGINTTAVINEDNYESALNPGNLAGFNDITLSHALTLKLAAGDDNASLEVWAGLQQMFDLTTGELSPLLNNLYLQRAGISWYMGDGLKFKLGRHSMLTGYGYGWNPTDFANTLKNPADPNADLTGVDSLLIHLFPESDLNLKVYALLDTAGNSLDYRDIRPGAELTAYLPFGEAKITGLYDWDETDGEDDKVSAIGAGLFLDIAGIGIYGEGAILDGSRSQFADSDTGELSRKTEVIFNALGGIEYTFEFGLTAAVEYFYNGEGYNRAEMAAYSDALESAAAAGAAAAVADDATGFSTFEALAAEYRQGNYSRHYILLNLILPLYEQNIDLSATALYSADTGNLTVLPRLEWWTSGGLSLEAGYAGLFDFYDYKGSEADLSPADHVIILAGKFSF